MATRFLLAAVAVCALLAVKPAEARNITFNATADPCDGNYTALSLALSNATNTALAQNYNQVRARRPAHPTSSRARSVSSVWDS